MDFFLWVKERTEGGYTPMMGHRGRDQKEWIQSLNAKDIVGARTEALLYLDTRDLDRNRDNEDFQIVDAAIFLLQQNIHSLYNVERYKRQADIERKRKMEELENAEAEVERLKKELGEPWNS